MVSSRVSAGALLTASALFLTACASGGGATDAGDGRIDIVASTSAYGQLAEEIGGDAVTVTSIITSASQDPHSFEASASDQLAVSRADLLIENGGGYDAFMASLLEASGTEAPVVAAVDYAGDHAETEASDDDHGHIEGFNEHVWYDPHTVVHVVEAIADELSDLRPPTPRPSTPAPPTWSRSSKGSRRASTRSPRRTPASACSSPSRFRCTSLPPPGS